MPYFERKPWSEMLGGLTDINVTPKAANDDFDIAELAQTILTAESRKHALDGPFRCRKQVCPEEKAKLVLNVAADDNGGPLTLDLSPGDLRARSGHVIPSNLVHVEPARLRIPPGGSQSFEVHVLVPHSAEQGLYSGRVVGNGPEPISFIVEFEVVPARED